MNSIDLEVLELSFYSELVWEWLPHLYIVTCITDTSIMQYNIYMGSSVTKPGGAAL